MSRTRKPRRAQEELPVALLEPVRLGKILGDGLGQLENETPIGSAAVTRGLNQLFGDRIQGRFTPKQVSAACCEWRSTAGSRSCAKAARTTWRSTPRQQRASCHLRGQGV
jgi:hypothetical protein